MKLKSACKTQVKTEKSAHYQWQQYLHPMEYETQRRFEK